MASASAVLQWYRIRWQIELFFKRCKSLLGLKIVVSASDALLRVRLLSSMLVAVLVDRMNQPALALPHATPPSLWRWTQLHHLDLVAAVSGDSALAKRQARVADVEPLLAERPRRRHAFHARRAVDKIDLPRQECERSAA
jgi:hypothetical protein